VPVPFVNSIVDYNRELFALSAPLLAKSHYRKGDPIINLFADDQATLTPLPRQPFNVCRYESLRADGYGKVCLDGKHYYSTAPEWGGQYVMVGIRAHTVEILRPDGNVLVTHPRSYSHERSDSLDHSTSLALLIRNAGAWQNSGLRSKTPDRLRKVLDEQNREELRKSLRMLAELSERYSFETAILAMEEAVSRGSLNVCDAAVLAARLSGYGLETPPELGPDLSCYDQLLTQTRGDLQ